MKTPIRVLSAALATLGIALGQTAAGPASIQSRSAIDQHDLGRWYGVPPVASPRLSNSTRIDELVRDHKLYLSLQDAIVLALENNLDLELERYDVRIAATDVLRAKSGAFPRGVALSIHEGPAGVGGPNATESSTTGAGTLGGGDVPALNGLVGTGTQTDLSILGSLPLSTGPSVPNLDPTITGLFDWNRTADPQNNIFLPGLRSLNGDSEEMDIALEKGFTTGATASIGWTNFRQDVNSPLLVYNPSTASSLFVTVNQPLLRGFGTSVNNRYIRITKNNQKISDLVFEQQTMASVASVVQLYWDLASLKEDVEVRREALQAAQQLYKDNVAAASEGTLAPIDVTRARAEVARRERDLSVSQTLVRQQAEVLKDYLTRTALDDRLADVEIELTDRVKAPDTEAIPPAEELMTEAFKSRPDLAQARLQLQNSQISLKGSKNALLPELNVFARVQNNSLAGSENPVANGPVLASTGAVASIPPNPALIGGYTDGLGQLFHHDFPRYEAGLQLNLPLANRAARADAARDLLQARQQEIRLRQLEKRAKLEITNAVLAIQQAKASFEAASRERALQQEAVAAEQEKLNVGASTTYTVMEYQGELAEARSAEISARSSFLKARTALQRALGTILTENNVSISDALGGVSSRRP
jgi:outer membrane protein